MILFFAHQSVGQDVLTGVGEIAARDADETRVAALSEYRLAAAAPGNPPDKLTVVHERVGRNRDPSSKLAQFRELLQAWPEPPPDVAMLKFCYVDIERSADAERLWAEYEPALATLQRRYPQTRFVHCTVPLRAPPFGLYAQLRRMLGHRHAQVTANRAREWFNDRLRERYAERGLLFDLALAEATGNDGRPCVVRESGQSVRCLAQEWTYDGGHLNTQGRTMAAAAFLHFFRNPR
jgi:hypothetical protein